MSAIQSCTKLRKFINPRDLEKLPKLEWQTYCKLLDLPKKCRDDICKHIKEEKSKIPERIKKVAASKNWYFKRDYLKEFQFRKFHVQLESLEFCTLTPPTSTQFPENPTRAKMILPSAVYGQYFSELEQPNTQNRKKHKRKHWISRNGEQTLWKNSVR